MRYAAGEVGVYLIDIFKISFMLFVHLKRVVCVCARACVYVCSLGVKVLYLILGLTSPREGTKSLRPSLL